MYISMKFEDFSIKARMGFEPMVFGLRDRRLTTWPPCHSILQNIYIYINILECSSCANVNLAHKLSGERTSYIYSMHSPLSFHPI